VLVNNAGVMRPGPVDGATTEDWRESVHVNILGVLYCTHAALPVMREQRAGHIANVSSMSGRRARAGTGIYSLTKFGVIGFSESLRQESAAHGIRVTLIEPGLVATRRRGKDRSRSASPVPRPSRPATSPAPSCTRSPSRTTSTSANW
jgi:NADP-dependent 3-hydroxy acid dehydrogenase YdfG